MVRALLLGLLGLLSEVALAAPRTPTVSELMDWAEIRYAAYFPGSQPAQQLAPYTYRFYPETGNYLGVAGTSVYVLGPVAGSNSVPLLVGDLSAFACEVFPASCVTGGYPSKAIRLVVPSTAGSVIDKLARDLAVAMQAALGQPVSVSNVAGGTTTAGGREVARAAADGYTILLHDMLMATVPSLFRVPPFKPAEDFEAVGVIAEAPMALIAPNSLPPEGYPALAQWLVANGSRVNMGNAGIGSLSFLCGLLFTQATNSPLVHIPYKGTAPALVDLIGGQVDLYCDALPTVGPELDARTVRAYGVTTPVRTNLPSYAALPTLAEGGLTGYRASNWYGLYAPRGTPAPVVERLSLALQAVRTDAEFKRRQVAARLEVTTDARISPTGHRNYLAGEMARWGPAIAAHGQFLD